MENNILKQRIMRRVNTVYYFRRLRSPFVLKAGLLGISVLALSYLVSFGNVFQNMPNVAHVRDFISFYSAAFLHTEFAVKAIATIGAIVFLYLLRDAIRNIRELGKRNAGFAIE